MIRDFYITEDGMLAKEAKDKFGANVRTIEEFYRLYKGNNEFDLEEVERCILLHKDDLLLRNHIMDAVSKGLLYSTRTTPNKGMYRMEIFKKEFLEFDDTIDFENKDFKIDTYHKTEEKEEKKTLLKKIIGR